MDPGYYKEQKAVACTSLAFQRFGQHKEVLSILCTSENTQARDVKLRLMQEDKSLISPE